MAHFAELDETNVVKQVIVVDNNELLVDGVESEAKGIAFCQSLFGSNWVQTSYNGTIRKNFAGIGMIYDSIRDAFYEPQPFPSWTLDEDAIWQPPVAAPVNPYTSDQEEYWLEPVYIWDETTLSWIAPTE